MPGDSSPDFRAKKAPECPHCGSSLYPYGALIKTWGLLEWVEAWHCATHGAVIQVKKDKGASEILSSLLFGFIHVLNTVDYFNGRWDFAWWWWLPNFVVGLFFGVLREKAGSVLAGSIIHGLTDVLAEVPSLLP